MKGLLLVGLEKVLHGLGLTGDRGGNTADDARLPEPQTCTSFPETRYPGLGRGRGKACTSVGVLEDFSILMKTLSHSSKSV